MDTSLNLKLKNCRSLTQKLFFITFTSIIFAILANYIIQNFFFQNYYIAQKTNNLIVEVNRFRKMYTYQLSDKATLTKALFNYEQNNNARIAIYSISGEIVMLPSLNKESTDLRTIKYFIEELLKDKQLITKSLLENQAQSINFYDHNQNEYIGIIAPMSLNEENDSIIVSVSSIKPIEEATSVTNAFYKFILGGFVIVVILLSYMYNVLVTRPIVKISNVAKKLSNLDFTETCIIESEDEIGNLAQTLNFLSSNLKSSLDDLKRKNKKLQEDIDKERQLENLRKDFVAGVSHELKTPIGIIKGYAEGIKDGIVTGDAALEYLNVILSEADNMSGLVSNMLELSKLDSGTIKLSLDSFNIIRLINRSNENISIEFSKKNIKSSFNCNFPYIYVEGDVFYLQQVINNLLTNAYKYSPKNNNVIINIRPLQNEKFIPDDVSKDDLILVTIENSGVHIPEEEINNIFSRFYRIDKSRNRSNNSFGLGLSIVKRILDMHDSFYLMENTDIGLKFSFTLKKSNTDMEIE